jgi:hypothetical protein
LQKLNVQDKVSNEWLQGLLKQYGITILRQYGGGRFFEITSELHNPMCYIKAHLGDFEIQDIINANETALFYSIF